MTSSSVQAVKVVAGVFVAVGVFAMALAVGASLFILAAAPVNDATPGLSTFPWRMTAFIGFAKAVPVAVVFTAVAYAVNRIA